MINPDRTAFNIFGRDIYWYGVLMAVGIVVAVWLATCEGKRKRLYKDAVIDLALVVIPCGIVGARVFYVLFNIEPYLANPISVFYLWEGGLAIYGAIIGGMIGMFFFARRKNMRFFKLADCVIPGLVLAQAIGRWGNFFNQEAYGLPVTAQMLQQFPFLSMFPFSVKIDAPWLGGFHMFNGEQCLNPIHLATFFYESAWCLLIFAFLWLRRKKFRHDGDPLFYYTLLYSFERMFVEGLRADSLWLIQPGKVAALVGGIRVSQLLSFLLFLGMGTFLLLRAIKEKQTGRLMWPAPEVLTDAEDAPEAEEADGDVPGSSDAPAEEEESGAEPEAEGDEPAEPEEDASEGGEEA